MEGQINSAHAEMAENKRMARREAEMAEEKRMIRRASEKKKDGTQRGRDGRGET